MTRVYTNCIQSIILLIIKNSFLNTMSIFFNFFKQKSNLIKDTKFFYTNEILCDSLFANNFCQ